LLCSFYILGNLHILVQKRLNRKRKKEKREGGKKNLQLHCLQTSEIICRRRRRRQRWGRWVRTIIWAVLCAVLVRLSVVAGHIAVASENCNRAAWALLPVFVVGVHISSITCVCGTHALLFYRTALSTGRPYCHPSYILPVLLFPQKKRENSRKTLIKCCINF
jgi:hypothetical protein